MNTLTKVLVGASVSLLTSMGFAADTGKETSTFAFKAGQTSGEGSGAGHWGMTSHKDGSGKHIVIFDRHTEKTESTQAKLSTSTHLNYDATKNQWTGTTAILCCKDLTGAKTKVCSHLKYPRPIELSDIQVNLDSENQGTVSYMDEFTVEGMKVTTAAFYKFSK
ncbi:hypothetical protein [Candidatus Sororendozoicomonas aggregata]|uniref:hypothetical protein n=1 Tax=Candidatus Sororendozoicomonas aggregata TaxID=3073239 RepID=UPI002ED19473